MGRSAFHTLWRTELKMFLREPYAVFFTLVFPILLLLIFGAAFGRFDADPGFRVVDVFVPSLIAIVAGYIGLVGVPIVFAEYREFGILRRYRVSPLSLGTLLCAQAFVQLLMLLAAAVLTIVLTIAVFGLRFGGNPVHFAALVLLNAAAMYSAGFALASVSRRIRTAQAVGAAVFFPMLFTSGATVPRQQFPEWLQEITDYVPLTHVVDSLTGAWIGRPYGRYEWSSIAFLVGITVVSVLFARWKFTWD